MIYKCLKNLGACASTHNISDEGLYIYIEVSNVCLTPFKCVQVKNGHIIPLSKIILKKLFNH